MPSENTNSLSVPLSPLTLSSSSSNSHSNSPLPHAYFSSSTSSNTTTPTTSHGNSLSSSPISSSTTNIHASHAIHPMKQPPSPGLKRTSDEALLLGSNQHYPSSSIPATTTTHSTTPPSFSSSLTTPSIPSTTSKNNSSPHSTTNPISPNTSSTTLLPTHPSNSTPPPTTSTPTPLSSSLPSSYPFTSPKRPRVDSLTTLLSQSKHAHLFSPLEYIEILKSIHWAFVNEPAHSFFTFPSLIAQWLSNLRILCLQTREWTFFQSSSPSSPSSLSPSPTPSKPLCLSTSFSSSHVSSFNEIEPPSQSSLPLSSSPTMQRQMPHAKDSKLKLNPTSQVQSKEPMVIQAIQFLEMAMASIKHLNFSLPFVLVELGVSELVKVQTLLLLDHKRFLDASVATSSPSTLAIRELYPYLELDLTESISIIFKGVTNETSHEKILELSILASRHLFEHAELLINTFQTVGRSIAFNFASLALQCLHLAWYPCYSLASTSIPFLKVWGDVLRWLAMHSDPPHLSFAHSAALSHSMAAQVSSTTSPRSTPDPLLLLQAARTWHWYSKYVQEHHFHHHPHPHPSSLSSSSDPHLSQSPLMIQKQAEMQAIQFYRGYLQWHPKDGQVIQELYELQPMVSLDVSFSDVENEEEEEEEEGEEEEEEEVVETDQFDENEDEIDAIEEEEEEVEEDEEEEEAMFDAEDFDSNLNSNFERSRSSGDAVEVHRNDIHSTPYRSPLSSSSQPSTCMNHTSYVTTSSARSLSDAQERYERAQFLQRHLVHAPQRNHSNLHRDEEEEEEDEEDEDYDPLQDISDSSSFLDDDDEEEEDASSSFSHPSDWEDELEMLNSTGTPSTSYTQQNHLENEQKKKP